MTVSSESEKYNISQFSHLISWRSNSLQIAAFLLFIWASIEIEEYGPFVVAGIVAALMIAAYAHGVILGRREIYETMTRKKLSKPQFSVLGIMVNVLLAVLGVYVMWNFF